MNLSCPPVILRFATFDDLNPVSNGEAEIAFSLKERNNGFEMRVQLSLEVIHDWTPGTALT
jgi:hypothetical protein